MIRVGIGGWTYEPWRGTFYPSDLPKTRELEFASRKLTAIEINGTFYRTQSPASFRKWAAETPDDFVFTVKGPRYVVQARSLAESGPGIDRFFASGLTELGRKLGPILWQFAPYRRFDEADCAAFLELLPRQVDGLAIRHAIEVGHESFRCADFLNLARRAGVAVVHVDADKRPAVTDVTGDFVYARLERTSEAEPSGYSPAEIDRWAERAREWEAGCQPADLPATIGNADQSAAGPRDVFVLFISGAKVRAPAAAASLIEKLRQ
jgi:uncharacterized protein YecE (DUF72 family)